MSASRIALISGLVTALVATSAPAFAGAIASSFKKETRRGANFWNAQAAIDGNLETCWQVPGESENIGEYLTLDVPKSSLDKIAMVVGWGKNDDTFKDYARVKTVRIEVFGYNEANDLVPAGHTTATFEDKMELQIVDVEDMEIGTDLFGGKVKVSVTEVYDGRDYPNIAVSELLLHLTEFDTVGAILDISGAADGHPQESMLDDNEKSYWAADADGAQMSFEASGYSVSSVGILAGPADYARPAKVKVSVGGRSATYEIAADVKGTQWFTVPAAVGYTGSGWGPISLEILAVHAGKKHPQVAIAELDLKATAYEGL